MKSAKNLSATSQLIFFDRLSAALEEPESTLLIYDSRLEKISTEFRAWAKRYRYRYAVASGEKLKDLAAFSKHAQNLAKLTTDLSPRSMTVLAVGGGSVGDFAGFFASVFKRGVRLVHMPSTWLAAIDSSHGGKTALNIKGLKNQIGTFYAAEKVILVRSLLSLQPEERVMDAMGELGKMALLDGGSWLTRLERTDLSDAKLLWEFLKPAVDAKMKVVEKDPREESGLRQILNLGHTVGHVFESAFGWSHGFSVAQGLFFAIEFSEARGYLLEKNADRARTLLSEKLGLTPQLPSAPLGVARFKEILMQDKKRSANDHVTFVFLKKIGSPLRESIAIKDIIAEAKRQGWVR